MDDIKTKIKEEVVEVEKEEETQLLTDSAILAIDDMCKNLDHNLTAISKLNPLQTKAAALNTKNMEFVPSLLKTDMKVNC